MKFKVTFSLSDRWQFHIFCSKEEVEKFYGMTFSIPGMTNINGPVRTIKIPNDKIVCCEIEQIEQLKDEDAK
jgi:hypothetical protein